MPPALCSVSTAQRSSWEVDNYFNCILQMKKLRLREVGPLFRVTQLMKAVEQDVSSCPFGFSSSCPVCGNVVMLAVLVSISYSGSISLRIQTLYQIWCFYFDVSSF